MAKTAKTAISVQDFAKTIKAQLRPLALRHALTHALGAKLKKNHGLTLHPKVLQTLQANLQKTSPALAEAMNSVTNRDEIEAHLMAEQGVVDAFLATVDGNVKAMEEQYLPQVAPEIQPLLKNLIHSLPFDEVNKAASQSYLEQEVAYMSTWQATIPLGDPTVTAFCNKMAIEINMRMASLAAETPNNFKNNLFSTFLADTNRSVWKLNDAVFDYKPQKQVVDAFTKLVPAPIDQQFLSKLTNQYLWSDLQDPLKATMMPAPNDPQQSTMQLSWPKSGDPVQQEERSNGLCFHAPHSYGDSFIDPNLVNLANDGSFSITIADDKKSAVVAVMLPNAIITDNDDKIPIGTCNLVMQLTCSLSGNDPNVRPAVTNVQISQEIKAL